MCSADASSFVLCKLATSSSGSLHWQEGVAAHMLTSMQWELDLEHELRLTDLEHEDALTKRCCACLGCAELQTVSQSQSLVIMRGSCDDEGILCFVLYAIKGQRAKLCL